MKLEFHPAGMKLEFHPLANLFPLMEGEEFDALVADIKANGQREPIVLYEDKILDGRNRYRACIAAGRSLGDILGMSVKGDSRIDNPAAYVISANIHRRHLTTDQKRDLIAKLIKANPEKSDRQIAKQVKADHKTVGAVRKAKEATGEISPVEKRVGKDGKARRRKKLKGNDPELTKALREGTVGDACLIHLAEERGLRSAHQLFTADDPVHSAEKAEYAADDPGVAPPQEIRDNILDTIARHRAVALGYKKVLKVASPFDGAMTEEISRAIGKLIMVWRSVQGALGG